MTVNTKIRFLKDEEIDSFIEERLREICNSEEKVIGFGTNITCYDGFLDDKVTANVSCEFLLVDNLIETYMSSIKFDDKEMYRYLIKEIKENEGIYLPVKKAVRKYLDLDSITRSYGNYMKTRSMIYHQYSSSMNKPLSIRQFHENKCAMCVEVAGVTQNMLRFLGIESDYVLIGEKDNDFHAFNIVYPNGRDKRAILYDFSTNYSEPLVCILDDEQKELLLSNKKIIITKEQVYSTYGKDIKMRQDEVEYYMFKDGNPRRIVEYKKPFSIIKNLKFKNEEL